MSDLTDLALESADYTDQDVVSMPASPSANAWSASAIQARFDNLVKSLLAVRFNGLLDLIASDGSGALADFASLAGAAAIAGVTGTTIGAQLADIYAQLYLASTGTLVADSITDAMLKDAGGIKASYYAHYVNFLSHIGSGGTLAGTASAFTATVTNFNAAAVQYFSAIANLANNAAATININGGGALNIVAYAGQTGTVVPNIPAGVMKQGGYYMFAYTPGSPAVVFLLNPEQTSAHVHTASQISDLANIPDTLLVNYAKASHAHIISNITGLQTALDAKSATTHTHTSLAALAITSLAQKVIGVTNVYILEESDARPASLPEGSLLITLEPEV